MNKKEILHDINFTFEKGKVYAIMGPNGSGKSTLAWALMGYPGYELSPRSRILFNGKDITEESAEKRAKRGIFLSFQSPLALPGVNIYQLLHYTPLKKKMDYREIKSRVHESAERIAVREDLLERSFQPGLSGGEKKKVEVLQARLLDPKLAIFDEIDTGVDVDALAQIASLMNDMKKNKTFLLITHYNRILKYVHPDAVLVLKDGIVAGTGGKDLAERIESEGYERSLPKQK